MTGSVIILHRCEAILHIPLRAVWKKTTCAPIAMLSRSPASRVSVISRAIRRPLGIMIRALMPVTDRAAHLQVMGKSVPWRSSGKAPSFHRQG
jgi:hypothetical protein